jgi:hypothetical protein
MTGALTGAVCCAFAAQAAAAMKMSESFTTRDAEIFIRTPEIRKGMLRAWRADGNG